MNVKQGLLVLALPIAMAACTPIGPDKGHDRGIDSKDLSQLKAGIWIDPKGCDHWIVDDGVEGYLSARLDKYGKPVCSGIAPPNYAVGPFKSGSDVADLL